MREIRQKPPGFDAIARFALCGPCVPNLLPHGRRKVQEPLFFSFAIAEHVHVLRFLCSNLICLENKVSFAEWLEFSTIRGWSCKRSSIKTIPCLRLIIQGYWLTCWMLVKDKVKELLFVLPKNRSCGSMKINCEFDRVIASFCKLCWFQDKEKDIKTYFYCWDILLLRKVQKETEFFNRTQGFQNTALTKQLDKVLEIEKEWPKDSDIYRNIFRNIEFFDELLKN